MSILDILHGRYVFSRRVRVLSDRLAYLIPPNARVLDVGCGNGRIARVVRELRPDVTIEGIDVLARPHTAIPVRSFDGTRIPHADKSFDAVVLVDVLHHMLEPTVLLREAARVARSAVILKDHTLEGPFAAATLRFMDWVGNERYGVHLPYNYWPRAKWEGTFQTLGLRVQAWTTSLRLYPHPASWVFDRSLHFIASVAP